MRFSRLSSSSTGGGSSLWYWHQLMTFLRMAALTLVSGTGSPASPSSSSPRSDKGQAAGRKGGKGMGKGTLEHGVDGVGELDDVGGDREDLPVTARHLPRRPFFQRKDDFERRPTLICFVLASVMAAGSKFSLSRDFIHLLSQTQYLLPIDVRRKE